MLKVLCISSTALIFFLKEQMGISDEKSSQEEYNCTCTHSLQTIKFTEIQHKVAFSLPLF